MDDTNLLPQDLTECHQLLLAAYKQSVELEQQAAESAQQVAELKRVLDETSATHQELQQTHAATLEELAWYKRWTFGRRRERFSEGEGQGHLFELDSPLTEESAEPETPDTEAGTEVKGHQRRKKRQIDWDKLRQIHHDHDLEPEEKICSCCNRQMDRIGEDITRELEFEPAKLEAHIHVRPKYACRHCKDGVSAAALPPRPIPGGIAGPGLITEVVVGKFSDHLPLYRLEDILTRYGVYFSRSTLCDWVKAVAGLFRPLYELQRQRVLQSAVMWTDDTRVTVLGGKEGSFKGYFWTYIGDDGHPYSVYDFTTSHSRDGPASFLEDYSGYLHADAYTGYDAMFSGIGSSVLEVACWAHTRRRFFNAVGNAPRQAHQMAEWIGQLYKIEHRAHDVSVEARRELRAAEAVPVLDKIETYLDEVAPRALPKSALAKAVTYARNQWTALRRYTEDGRLTIDNNISERTLRHQAIGRKNWLFLGSEAAGPRAAVLYTILAGAKRHRIEPWTYVRDILLRLHADDQCLEDLLPDRWAAAHPEAILNHRLEESRTKAIRARARHAHRHRRSK
ncbi:MAG TPA: IS66 family transposase [Pirellulaceae bacterium]|jgi:transposase|nr:IS66 family transposase [Pirellulaceae bacterium]|tara:strand:+ start:880 stop:2574 length:1695 start_codon:yes stop_codon:yes gene_type:complete